MKNYLLITFLSIGMLASSCKSKQGEVSKEKEQVGLAPFDIEYEPVNQGKSPKSKLSQSVAKSPVFKLSKQRNLFNEEATKILLHQDDENQPFIIQDVFLGTNKTFVPAVNVVMNEGEKQSVGDLIEASREVSKALDTYKNARQSIIFRKEKRPYAIVFSGENNQFRRTVALDTVFSIVKFEISKLREKIEANKSENLYEHDIVKAYLHVDSDILRGYYSIMLMSKTRDGSFYRSRYNYRAGLVKRVNYFSKENGEYIMDISSGNGVKNDKGMPYRDDYKLTYYNDLIMISTRYNNYEDNYYTNYEIEIPL